MCKEYNYDESCFGPPLLTGADPDDVLFMMIENELYFVKLETCFPENKTIKMLQENIYKNTDILDLNPQLLRYLEKGNFDFDYFADSGYSDCCMSNSNECINPSTSFEEKIHSFKIKISNVHTYESALSKEKYTDEILSNIHNIIKLKIYCKKPIITSIIATEEYCNFFYVSELSNIYFQPSEKILTNDEIYDNNLKKYNEHVIVILGWEKKDGIEYWIIRDSNSDGEYYRIAFSKMYNIDSWLGHDIDWIENREGRMNTNLTTISLEPQKEDDILYLISQNFLTPV